MARYDDRHQDRYPARPTRRRGADQGMERGDYYDPDHEYRTRRYRRDSDRGESYAQRLMPGEHADRRRDGRYRGVGPKGYVRSDERIRELVCDAVKDGEVTLSGSVDSRDAKRLPKTLPSTPAA